MSGRLLIHYRDADSAPGWLLEDERGRVLAGPSQGALPARDAGTEIVVLAPAEAIASFEAAVPARSREQLLRALPYALEDAFAEGVEQLQFAAQGEVAGIQRVAAVRAATLREWLAGLARLGVTPDRIVADAAALPFAGAPTLRVDGERVLVRLDAARAFACELEAVGTWLAAAGLAASADGRIALSVIGAAPPTLDPARHAIESAPDEATLRVLARGLRASAPPNLARGAHAPAHRGAPLRRLWRIAAMLAAGVIAVGLLQMVLANWSLSRRLADAMGAQRELYREVYPGERELPDPASRMRAEARALGPARSGGGVLALLDRVAPVLAANTQHTLEAIDWRNGVLELGVRAADVATLDALRESVATVPGLRVELASAQADAGAARGQLRVREGAP
jgi:general secretion pathway protein L